MDTFSALFLASILYLLSLSFFHDPTSLLTSSLHYAVSFAFFARSFTPIPFAFLLLSIPFLSLLYLPRRRSLFLCVASWVSDWI
ncbi:hypothetical protein BDY24DRAFT_396489 [Mrakia frigida]|uniref:uncharacterized protein n=1 Tax=Mrakia frigida TaxID=29902 RepID=UPI003FCC2022